MYTIFDPKQQIVMKSTKKLKTTDYIIPIFFSFVVIHWTSDECLEFSG